MAVAESRIVNLGRVHGKVNSGHTAVWGGDTKFLVNCHQCKNDVSNPSVSGIAVEPYQRTVTCKAGHVIVVRY